MHEDKGIAANTGRFAGDYEEWTDWDGPRAPPFRPSVDDLYARSSPERTTHAQDILFLVSRTGERIFPPFCPTTSHFEDTISKQITSPAPGARPIRN